MRYEELLAKFKADPASLTIEEGEEFVRLLREEKMQRARERVAPRTPKAPKQVIPKNLPGVDVFLTLLQGIKEKKKNEPSTG
jgi:hypothetical protein